MVVGTLVAFVPLTLTMFAVEARARFLKNPAAHADEPQLLCQSTLELYEAVRALPVGERTVAVRGLFLASGEGK
jgi:hypothetical protein